MQFFSVRRLSPFQGTVQIIDAQESRAFSNNGISWQIQIKHHLAKPNWGSLENIFSAQKYVRYGIWNEQQGLNRFSIPPTLNADHVNQLGSEIIQEICTHQEQLPFKLTDCFEHWLLDRESLLPAALLTSSIEEQRIDQSYAPEWQSHNNEMPPMNDTGDSEKSEQDPFDRLEQLLKFAAGQPPLTQWFERLPDGSGRGIYARKLDKEKESRTLADDVFPTMLLRNDWRDEDLNALVRRYHQWQAPYLLTLTTITDDQRGLLEVSACKNPLLVYELHRLFPKIVQKKLIKRAIVEAQLRLTNT